MSETSGDKPRIFQNDGVKVEITVPIKISENSLEDAKEEIAKNPWEYLDWDNADYGSVFIEDETIELKEVQ